jgi:hypothetical protein
MERTNNSPKLHLVYQTKDRLFATSTQVNSQEVAREKQEHPEGEMPSFPFLYQG